MVKPRFNGKDTIACYLANKEGYTYEKALNLVNQVISIIKSSLIEGKNVEIEGLGILKIMSREPKRAIRRGLRRIKPTILTLNKQKKTIKLKKHIFWEGTDC